MTDELWRELAQVNRDEQAEDRSRLDDRWDRLSHGQLSPEEEAELRALAETSEEARKAWEAFRPLGSEFHASVVRAVREQQAEAEAKALEPKAKVLPFPRRLAGWSAAATAVAAVVLVMLLRLPEPVPEYGLPEVSGGIRPMRGESGETAVRFAPGAPLQVVLRPSTATSGAEPLEARCFLSRNQEIRLLEVRSELAPRGAVKVNGAVPGDVQPGVWTLWTVIGRPGKLPDPADLRPFSAERQVRQRSWVASSRDILIEAREDLPP